MHVQPYLFFNGRCEEALEFYKQRLGAEVGMMLRFKDNPDKPGPEHVAADLDDKIMHAAMRIGASVLFASDGTCMTGKSIEGVSLSISVATPEDADRIFEALADGGTVQMPIGKTFFSPRFGSVVDKFGVSWMVVNEPKS